MALASKVLKKRISIIIKAVVSLVIISTILISLIKIRQNDIRLAVLANNPVEEYSMELPNTNLGEEGFKLIANNEKLSLLANIPTGEVALKDNISGKIWYSNPQDRTDDKLAVMATRSSSQIIVKFIDMESGNDLTVDSRIGSILKKGLDFELTDKGIKFIYHYPSHGIIIPVEYTLLEDSLEAKVIIDEIEEQNSEAYKIINISLLPFFAAGGINDSGYMFVPDGSGALINYNNGKINCAEYSEAIYGSDILITDSKSHEITESIRMPVFGNKTNDQGFLGIVTSGEASGRVNSTISGVITGYNQVYSSINYRDIFITEVDKQGAKRQLKQYGDCTLKGTDYVVRYYPLLNDDANYSGMAKCYRNYLKGSGLLVKKNKTESAMALEIYGAIRTTKNVLGVEKEIVTPLSNYSQIYDLCASLVKDGARNFQLLYKGWNEGGLKAATNTDVSPEKELGGKKELQKLLDFARENNIKFYLENDFSNLYKNGKGLSHVSDAAKLLTQDSAKLFEFKYASVDINEDFSRYLIMPSIFEELANEFSLSAKKHNITGVAETSFGQTLYSDYSKKSQSLRYQSQEKIVSSLKNIKNNVADLAVTGGNAYTLFSADMIFDTPTKSSGFDIVDETVPFYSMVLHGYFGLATETVNFSENPEIARLKAIEIGCMPKYTLMYGDTSVLIGTQYSDLFNVRISDLYKEIIENYNTDNNLFKKINSLEIKTHKKIQDGVYSTEYEDGTIVIVNYTDKAVNFNNTKVKALNYIVN